MTNRPFPRDDYKDTSSLCSKDDLKLVTFLPLPPSAGVLSMHLVYGVLGELNRRALCMLEKGLYFSRYENQAEKELGFDEIYRRGWDNLSAKTAGGAGVALEKR